MYSLFLTTMLFIVILVVIMMFTIFLYLLINYIKSSNITEIQRDEQGRITSIINKQI